MIATECEVFQLREFAYPLRERGEVGVVHIKELQRLFVRQDGVDDAIDGGVIGYELERELPQLRCQPRTPPLAEIRRPDVRPRQIPHIGHARELD